MKRSGVIPLDLLKQYDLDIDELRCIQRETFYLDKWYDALSDLTFPSIIITLKPSEKSAMMNQDFERLKKLEKKMTCMMDSYGSGDIKFWFVKLNSVAPKDSAISGKQLKFNNAHDILKRLIECPRTNGFIRDDPNVSVVLREWQDIPEFLEFRCFIRKKKLRAISQYQCYEYFQEIHKRKEELKCAIVKIFNSIRKRIPYEDTTMDIVVLNTNKIVIIEFNQFGAETACGACLYNWDLDYQILYHSKSPDMRIIETPSENC